jgi:DNA-binding MarR family transcriptional regulator
MLDFSMLAQDAPPRAVCGGAGERTIVDADNKFRQDHSRRRMPRRFPRRPELPMSHAKRVKITALRKAQAPLRRSRPVIDLGVLNDRLGYFVRRLQVSIFQDFIRRLSSIDISPAQFSVLVVIDANPGLSQAELSTTLAIERARLVRVLHHLQRRGLIQRLPSSVDGRRHELQLTRDGQKALARAQVLAEEHETALRQKLGAERHQILLESLREVH